jgi:hypothetical protein
MTRTRLDLKNRPNLSQEWAFDFGDGEGRVSMEKASRQGVTGRWTALLSGGAKRMVFAELAVVSESLDVADVVDSIEAVSEASEE